MTVTAIAGILLLLLVVGGMALIIASVNSETRNLRKRLDAQDELDTRLRENMHRAQSLANNGWYIKGDKK